MALPQAPLEPMSSRWRSRDLAGFEDPLARAFKAQSETGTSLYVISEFCDDDDPPFWTLSICADWRRPRQDEVIRVLQDFGAEGFEEIVTGGRSLIRHFSWPPLR